MAPRDSWFTKRAYLNESPSRSHRYFRDKHRYSETSASLVRSASSSFHLLLFELSLDYLSFTPDERKAGETRSSSRTSRRHRRKVWNCRNCRKIITRPRNFCGTVASTSSSPRGNTFGTFIWRHLRGDNTPIGQCLLNCMTKSCMKVIIGNYVGIIRKTDVEEFIFYKILITANTVSK